MVEPTMIDWVGQGCNISTCRYARRLTAKVADGCGCHKWPTCIAAYGSRLDYRMHRMINVGPGMEDGRWKMEGGRWMMGDERERMMLPVMT